MVCVNESFCQAFEMVFGFPFLFLQIEMWIVLQTKATYHQLKFVLLQKPNCLDWCLPSFNSKKLGPFIALSGLSKAMNN